MHASVVRDVGDMRLGTEARLAIGSVKAEVTSDSRVVSLVVSRLGG
jgi:hypothetical protein